MVRYSENLLEDLVLLSLNKDGTVPSMSKLYRPFRVALRAALVLELILQGRVTIDPPTGIVYAAKSSSESAPTPLDNPLLAEALDKIEKGPHQTVAEWIDHFWKEGGIKNFRKRLMDHLVEHRDRNHETLLCKTRNGKMRLSELATRKRLVNQLRYLLLTDPEQLAIYAQTGESVNVEHSNMAAATAMGTNEDKSMKQRKQQQQHGPPVQDYPRPVEQHLHSNDGQGGHGRYHFQYGSDPSPPTTTTTEAVAPVEYSAHAGYPSGAAGFEQPISPSVQTVYHIDAPGQDNGPVQYVQHYDDSPDNDDASSEDGDHWGLYPELAADQGWNTTGNVDHDDDDDGFDIVTDEEAAEIRDFIEQRVESLTSLQYVRLKFLLVLLMMDSKRFFPRIFSRAEMPHAMQAAQRITRDLPGVNQGKPSPSSSGSSSSSSSSSKGGSGITLSDAADAALTVAAIAGVVLYIGVEVLSIGLQIAAALN